MKVGKEVSGRFKGLHTLYLTKEEFDKELSVLGLISENAVQQIYILDLDNELSLDESLLRLCADRVVVTVECTELRRIAPHYIEIMLNVAIQKSTLFNLGPGDQIKFEHDQFVFSSVVENMTQTLPSDFEGRITVRGRG